MALIIVSIVLVGIFLALMSVRVLFIKDGEFRGTCASQSPWLRKEGITCNVCGKTLSPDDQACGDTTASSEDFPEISKNRT